MIANSVNNLMRRVPPWSLYLLGAGHIAWLVWLGATGGLGLEPIKALEHELGLAGLQMLLVGLAITPLRRFTGISLIRFRRAVGLIAFMYIAVHLTVWLVLDLHSFDRIWSDILKRPYITIGMVGFVLLIPLAITSNNLSVRRLGRAWRQLHKLAYIIVVLGAVHFVMVRKGIQIEPLIYLAVGLGLLLTRLRLRRQPTRVVTRRDTA